MKTQPPQSPTLGKINGWTSVVSDYAADKAVFRVSANKTMMWIFLLSDTFVFGCFLVGYMSVRMTTTDPWPLASEVFALTIAGHSIPLILIAIMTFVLITSSGTMAMAVNCGYQGKRYAAALLMLTTALLGLTFVGMQAFEWSKLIEEGVRPWGNEAGASQFGAAFFMITGFHGLHVSVGVIYLTVVAIRVALGKYDRQQADPHAAGVQGGRYEIVEIAGLYWHFVDLVWVFIFAFFYLW
ncbi:heme-copper oxidase subunit III family protein [Photobacterium sp. 1_MG-2023]|uniref:heme-copper oxidase subunit III family protein n=1 Tax=Photobacterium sp. 1_MG-2023 TaxID=3062646 RepID=UPI0026E427F4|nr:heme-copper oxidase subunit III family protein [Photobacterium sp. 1_MG-2023]MDO6707303.1 heme-copper oxidase subunit III family protein [Photobacterium sp. 1_MG-2023]